MSLQPDHGELAREDRPSGRDGGHARHVLRTLARAGNRHAAGNRTSPGRFALLVVTTGRAGRTLHWALGRPAVAAAHQTMR